MKSAFNLLRVGFILALFVSIARAEISWTNTSEGTTQVLTVRTETWIVNDAGDGHVVAESATTTTTLTYGQTASYADSTFPYDGAYGEFYAPVHYVIVHILDAIDELDSLYTWQRVAGTTDCVWVAGYFASYWVDGYWSAEYDEYGNVIGGYWVDGHEEAYWVDGHWDGTGVWQRVLR